MHSSLPRTRTCGSGFGRSVDGAIARGTRSRLTFDAEEPSKAEVPATCRSPTDSQGAGIGACGKTHAGRMEWVAIRGFA
jgi:hypothetical protein